MSLEITGKVTHILDEIKGEGRNGTWRKQDFVIETMSEYPKSVCFSGWNDTCDQIQNLKVGEILTISFSPESKEYNTRWYTELRAWRISSPNAKPRQEQPKPETPTVNNEGDDIPF